MGGKRNLSAAMDLAALLAVLCVDHKLGFYTSQMNRWHRGIGSHIVVLAQYLPISAYIIHNTSVEHTRNFSAPIIVPSPSSACKFPSCSESLLCL